MLFDHYIAEKLADGEIKRYLDFESRMIVEKTKCRSITHKDSNPAKKVIKSEPNNALLKCNIGRFLESYDG